MAAYFEDKEYLRYSKVKGKKVLIPKKEIVIDDYGDFTPNVKILRDRIIAHERWSIVHNLIFEYEGNIYGTLYSVGATESQDHHIWDCYDMNEGIPCILLKEVQIEKTEYIPVSG